MTVGFLSDLFSSEARNKKKVASLTKKMQMKFGQTDDRRAAMETLRKIGTPEAIAGLLKRLANTIDNKMHDQDEKQEASDILNELGRDKVMPALKEFLERETEVTWALRTARRLLMKDQWIELVIETLGDSTSEDTDPEKICQILTVLHECDDPRVPGIIARCLTDFDDTVRFAAIEALASIPNPEAAREPLLQALTRPEEDSQRVRHRIIDVFMERGWEVKGYRKSVEELLPEEGYYLDRSGRIKQLRAGAQRPADE